MKKSIITKTLIIALAVGMQAHAMQLSGDIDADYKKIQALPGAARGELRFKNEQIQQWQSKYGQQFGSYKPGAGASTPVAKPAVPASSAPVASSAGTAAAAPYQAQLDTAVKALDQALTAAKNAGALDAVRNALNKELAKAR